jgi:peptide subunit release factor 1 (eRF1)
MATSAPDKTTTSLETPLKDQLDRLAAFEPNGAPVISLYLDMRANQNGRPNFETYLRKALPEQAGALKGDERKSVEADIEHIQSYLSSGVRGSANALAIFACHASNLFETIELDAAGIDHWLSVGPVPHLYPLARLNDQYPRYAALLVNTNSARMFVFSLGTTESQQRIANQKTRKTTMGGWSQARYQRHNENFHLLHMKEVVERLEQLVTSEGINHIVVSCDEVAKPLLMEQLPKHVAEKVIDIVHLPATAPDHEVLQHTLEVLRGHDADTDVAQVEEMLGAWRAGGLGTAGLAGTRAALEMGQVEELIITAQPGELGEDVANELVTKAQQTSARVRFIEDASLMEEAGGVGAILRFRI